MKRISPHLNRPSTVLYVTLVILISVLFVFSGATHSGYIQSIIVTTVAVLGLFGWEFVAYLRNAPAITTDGIVVYRVHDICTCDLYDNNGKYVATIDNHLTLLSVQAQIKKNKIRGYFIEFQRNSYKIDSTGKIEGAPETFFPRYQYYLNTLSQ